MEHPGKILLDQIRDRGRTQKQFASFVGKKNSEVNELIKGKRNITVQRDILLSEILGTPEKYWINMQVDYDYKIAKAEMEKEKNENQIPVPEIIGQDFNTGGSDLNGMKVYDKNNVPKVENSIELENKNGETSGDPNIQENLENISDQVVENQGENVVGGSLLNNDDKNSLGDIKSPPNLDGDNDLNVKNDEKRKRKKLEKILLDF